MENWRNTPRDGGTEIVLTASRSDMSDFGNDAFNAFQSTFPYKLAKKRLSRFLEPIINGDGTTHHAPYGLRKIEALLVKEFGESSVAVVHPKCLDKFVGKNTKLICISVHDPAGLAYVSRTYNSLLGFGRQTLNSHEFENLMRNPAISSFKGKIVAGGPGVWQVRDAGYQDRFGIDHLIVGDAEKSFIPLVRRLMNGEKLEREIHLEPVNPKIDPIPTITKPSTFGSIEITRGCGRGCHFCTPDTRARYSFPLDHIMKEVKVNIDGGLRSVFIVSDDLFLYRALPSFKPNTEKVVELFETMAKYPGLEEIHLSHASLAPVVYDPKLLEELSPILLEKTNRTLKGQKYLTVEIGIESGSVRIIGKYMRGKALPFRVEEWPEVVVQGLGMMNDHGWYPLCTFITGMPDETDRDVTATLELIDGLKGLKLFYVPLLFIPFEQTRLRGARRIGLEHLSDLQWGLIAECWSRNIDIWERSKIPFYRLMAFLAFNTYLRWIHGAKVTRGGMRFVGFDGIKNFRSPSQTETYPDLTPNLGGVSSNLALNGARFNSDTFLRNVKTYFPTMLHGIFGKPENNREACDREVKDV